SEAARLCGSTHRCFATHTPWTFHHATSRFSTAFSYTMRRPSPMLNNPERPRNVRLVRANCTVSRAGTPSNTLMSAIPIIEPTPNTAIYGNAANGDETAVSVMSSNGALPARPWMIPTARGRATGQPCEYECDATVV